MQLFVKITIVKIHRGEDMKIVNIILVISVKKEIKKKKKDLKKTNIRGENKKW